MKVLKYIFSMMLLGGIISACADLDTKLTNEWSESDKIGRASCRERV